jgi:hypothetical protein
MERRRGGRTSWAGLFLAAAYFAAAATRVSGDDAGTELVWHAPAGSGCASASEIVERVRRLTDRALSTAASRHHPQIVVDLLEFEYTWRARVGVVELNRGVRGQRELQARSGDCRSLDVAVAVVIATLLEGLPDAPLEAEPTTDVRAAGKPALPHAPVVASSTALMALSDVATGTSVLSRRERRYGLAAAFASAVGLGPSLIFGAQLALQLPWAFQLDGSLYAPRAELDSRGRGARWWTWHAGARFCPLRLGERLELQLCATGELGAIHALGVGLTPAVHEARLLVVLGISPQLAVNLTPGLQLRFDGVAGWVPVRPRFAMDLGSVGLHTFGSAQFALLLHMSVIGFLL